MAKVLIFGLFSYIGNAFAFYGAMTFDLRKVSSRGEAWRCEDFSGFDAVLFCAGIAHQRAADELHFRVNCDLALEVAERARSAGARQFVYLSSAAALRPSNAYGKSKLQAEKGLLALCGNGFAVTIVRPPMVYGPDCKGNFERLVWLARKTPVFPDVNNRRSMIYIENLCYFLSGVIEDRAGGVFFAQNEALVCTTELVRCIARCLGRRIWFTRLLNPLIRLFFKAGLLDKMFGDFMCEGPEVVSVGHVEFEESVRRSLKLTPKA